MKEFQQEIYDMYTYDNMTIRDIAFQVGLDTNEVKDIITFMTSLGE